MAAIDFERQIFNLLEHPPAIVTLKYSSLEHRRLNLTGLKIFILETSSVLENFLAKERFMLSRLLYQLNSAFKKHKFFQFAKNLSKMLRRAEEIGIACRMNEVSASIELDLSDSCRFLSSERFDFAIANIFTMILTLKKVTEICSNCYIFLGTFMDLGHFTAQCCLFVGLVAGIRSQCLVYLRKLTILYRQFISLCQSLKPANELYSVLPWPDEDETFLNKEETLPKNETTNEHMAFFEGLLKNYNSKMDLKTGLNRAILNKVNLKINETETDSGYVVERKDNLIEFRLELSNVKTVKSLKLFHHILKKSFKNVSKDNKRKVIKATRLLTEEYKKILSAKKLKDKEDAKMLFTDLKKQLKLILS